jgi:hypothetical protein
MTETGLVVIKQGFALPEEGQFKTDLKAIARFQAIVQQELIEGVDYGEIPGTKKNTLLKPGAEKIAKLLGLSDRYEILPASIENWERPLFYYQVKCTLTHEASGMLVSEGLGSCNSMEDKYRYRWLWPGDVPVNVDKGKLVTRKLKGGGLQYRTDNEEIFTIVNTILKIAKKRALVDAALSAGRLSNVFTQDMEDIAKAMADDAPDEDDKPAAKPSNHGNCPECKSPMVMRSGKFGDFLACSGYPKCQYKPPKDKPAPATDTPPPVETPELAPDEEIDTVHDAPEDWSKANQAAFFAEMDRVILDKGLPAHQVKAIMAGTFRYSKRTEITIAKRNDVIRALREA